jgi:4-diphosphocytidyl-2-C-methyl-D-erythritol kinase
MPAFARARANAKVNLWLAVRGQRTDGYHEIETVFCSIGLADEITVLPAPSGSVEVVMSFDGTSPALVESEENLVHRAAIALLEHTQPSRGVRIEILKRIPTGAGLGGGSADAATVLLLLQEVWGLPPDLPSRVAPAIGSDVPFLLQGGVALAAGRGDQVHQLEEAQELWFVLGISNAGLGTREVYAEWDRSGVTTTINPNAVLDAMRDGNLASLGQSMHNDLAAPAIALRPELGDLVSAMASAGALGACISGSGPTVFGVAQDATHARDIAGRLGNSFDRVRVAASRRSTVERLD